MSSHAQSSNMSFEFSLKTLINYDVLEVQDLVRSAALIVAFVVLLWRGSQRVWALADVIGMALCGLACYFFPQSFLQYQVDATQDVVHLYILQVGGAILIGLAAARYCNLDTRDHYCMMANILSRLLGSSIMLIALIYSQVTIKTSQNKQKFTQQHISFAILGCGLWLAGHAVQIYNAFGNSGRRGSSIAVHNRRDVHLLIGAILAMTTSLFHLAFPDALPTIIGVKGFTGDTVHFYLLRVVGITLFIGGLYSLASLNFESDTDKKSVFFGGLVTHAMIYPVMVLYQWKHNMYYNITLVLVMSGLQTVNLLMGYCDCQTCLPHFIAKFKQN